MQKTLEQYQNAMAACKKVFMTKNEDYGTAWRILRLSSLTDQMYIKARRIRSIEERGVQKIEEGVVPEFIGLVNYGIMALMKLDRSEQELKQLDTDQLARAYDEFAESSYSLMQKKNHDYGEAWRNMRVSSLTDLILMKLLRIRQIEDNKGQTLDSEGLDANYIDIINYSIFALIRLEE